MPDENIRFQPQDQLLTFEEVTRLTRIMVGLGVDRLRITGGEPLVRAQLPKLVSMLKAIPGVEDIALTTNGILLADQARSLRDAGLDRINVSLDGLSEATFQRISRRQGLDRVLEGIFTARRVGFEKIRLNAVAIRGITEPEIVPLGRFAREQGMEMRFIEFMPLDAEQKWQTDRILTGDSIRQILEAEWGPLVAVERPDPSQPAIDYEFADGLGRIGFINPVSQPFCHACNRLRITAEGKLRNCLFSTSEWDLRSYLRGDSTDALFTDEEIADAIRECVLNKKPGHGIDDPDFIRPERAMYQIGG